MIYIYYCGFPDGEVVKNLPANAGDTEDVCLILRLRRSLGVGNATSVSLPGKFHGQKSLVGYSSWGCKESDMTELVRMHKYCLNYFSIF